MFGLRREQRPDADVIGAIEDRFRACSRLWVETPTRARGPDNRPRLLFHSQLVLADVHAIGPRQPSEIGPVVHDK